MTKELPNFLYENKLWKRGLDVVIGMDEVGRGAFAGSVVAACVSFPKNIEIGVYINDSKKMTRIQREKADIWIRENASCFGIGSASVAQINKFGIKKATEIAFRKAIRDCGKRVDYLLMDAFYVPYVKGLRRKNQKPIVKGDTKSISIAAASIIAKVYRDKAMTRLARNPKYKKYKWNENKGYGTKDHQKAIKLYGKTRLHRVSFLLKLS